MSTIKLCDGCGVQLGGPREPTISGARANGVCGGVPLPSGEFDWCVNCALVAFDAVKNATDCMQSGPVPGDPVRASYVAARKINPSVAMFRGEG